MKWNKFTLKTRSEVEDIVISTLADVGIEGVEIQDKQPLTESDKQQMFVDIMPDIPDDDGIAYLNFYLDVDEDKEKVLADVRAALAEMQEFLDLGECTITESETEDKDWINFIICIEIKNFCILYISVILFECILLFVIKKIVIPSCIKI